MKLYDVIEIVERENKSNIVIAKFGNEEFKLYDKDKSIKGLGKYKLSTYVSEFDNKSYEFIKDVDLIEPVDDYKPKENTVNSGIQPASNKDLIISRLAVLNTATEIIKLKYNNKLIDKDPTDEIIALANKLEQEVYKK
jgi:hypothetical protein